MYELRAFKFEGSYFFLTSLVIIKIIYNGKTFDIKCFDPRNGVSLQEGSITSVKTTWILALLIGEL